MERQRCALFEVTVLGLSERQYRVGVTRSKQVGLVGKKGAFTVSYIYVACRLLLKDGSTCFFFLAKSG